MPLVELDYYLLVPHGHTAGHFGFQVDDRIIQVSFTKNGSGDSLILGVVLAGAYLLQPMQADERPIERN
jgi:hypothetical protein